MMQNSKQGRGLVGVDEAASVCVEVLISLSVCPVILPCLEFPVISQQKLQST